MGAPAGRSVRETGRTFDWEAIEATEEFRTLVARRRRFVLPATIFFLVWYLGFVLLCGYAKSFMGESVYQGVTVGYVLALTQFVMTFVLGFAYLRYSTAQLDPLRERIRAAAHRLPVRDGTDTELESPAFHPGRLDERTGPPVGPSSTEPVRRDPEAGR